MTAHTHPNAARTAMQEAGEDILTAIAMLQTAITKFNGAGGYKTVIELPPLAYVYARGGMRGVSHPVQYHGAVVRESIMREV